MLFGVSVWFQAKFSELEKSTKSDTEKQDKKSKGLQQEVHYFSIFCSSDVIASLCLPSRRATTLPVFS